MEEEEAGSVAYRSFSHPSLPQKLWNCCSIAWPLGTLWFHLVVTHDQAKCHSLSSHSLEFCKLSTPYNHSSMSTVLCFLSPLWRLQADRLLTFSAVDRVTLSLNSLPQVSSRSSHLASSPPRIAFNISPVPWGNTHVDMLFSVQLSLLARCLALKIFAILIQRH